MTRKRFEKLMRAFITKLYADYPVLFDSDKESAGYYYHNLSKMSADARKSFKSYQRFYDFIINDEKKG